MTKIKDFLFMAIAVLVGLVFLAALVAAWCKKDKALRQMALFVTCLLAVLVGLIIYFNTIF